MTGAQRDRLHHQWRPRPSQIYSLSPAGKVEQWTQAATEGVDTRQFSEQSIVRWKSFDGMTISGLLSQPSATRFPGRRPVIISIHGGPEAQATVGFIGRNNYYVNELGIALIQPNVRGSTGYGKSFLAADNGFKREDSVKDVGALLDWIATQPHLDPKRVLVMGGSYGGYMTLAVATHYADRIAGAIDIVGISHFLTFLQNTESYRRDLRRVEYGDERDPAMREFLERISPLTNAAKIKATVRGARQERPARALHRGRADRCQGARIRHASLVPARRERRPRLCAQGEPGLPVPEHHLSCSKRC